MFLDLNIEEMGFNFSYDKNVFGQLIQLELVENGSEVPVTEENKKDFIKKYCYAKMT